ncbi:MAG: hypothetical protein HYX78_07120 [Armatimonadetes bacterium]|nr:hypothetical protein [Armatimonadota bacterium]
MKYICVLLASSIALLLCLQPQNLAVQTGDEADHKGSEKLSRPLLELLWKRPIEHPVWMSISPDGGYVAAVSKTGDIYCFGAGGRTVWKIGLPGVDRVAVGSDASAVAYSYLNPSETHVYLIDPTGKIKWRHKVEGAVWAVAASPDAGRFAVGTGEAYCYSYTISKTKHRYKRWKLPGAPCSVYFAPDGRSLIFGTWQNAGIGRFDGRGHRLDWKDGEPDRLYSVQISGAGQHILVVAKPNRSDPIATISLKNADLQNLWTKDFQVRDLKVDIASDGDYVAVGFERPIAHGDEKIWENRVALYNRSGQILWEKGGVFGKWDLLQACASGNLLLYDESAALYVLDKSGRMLLRHKLPARVIESASGPSRDMAALYFSDGLLCLFRTR